MLIFPFLLFISLNTEHSAIKVICKCGWQRHLLWRVVIITLTVCVTIRWKRIRTRFCYTIYYKSIIIWILPTKWILIRLFICCITHIYIMASSVIPYCIKINFASKESVFISKSFIQGLSCCRYFVSIFVYILSYRVKVNQCMFLTGSRVVSGESKDINSFMKWHSTIGTKSNILILHSIYKAFYSCSLIKVSTSTPTISKVDNISIN
mgnify:FL=1